MEARGIKPRKRRLPARYWRLRFACDIAARLAEYDDERREHDYGDREDAPGRYWYWERDLITPLDALLLELRSRIRAVGFFNPLPLSSSSSPRDRAPLPDPDRTTLEQRLVDHLDRLHSSPDLAWLLADEPEDDLARLDAIADTHFGGWLDPLLGLVLVRRFWIRPLASWVAPTDGSAWQGITSLAKHLLVEFQAPLWLCRADANCSSASMMRWLTWLIALGQGGSLRRLVELGRTRWPEQWRPVAHKLIAALAKVPDIAPPSRGIMLAEILRLGGSTLEWRWLERAGFVVDPSAGEVDEAELAFWRQTIAWLIRHRERLDDHGAAMILAWARHMQTERRRRATSFDWGGRTFESAERDARAYQQSLALPHVRWLSWRAQGWEWEGRFGEHDWTIRELRSSEALRAESQAMSHCVRLYDLACWRGHSAIFSLMQGESRRVTIEIDLPSRTVAQAKRACNAEPSALEHAVIEHWRSSVVDPRR
jgi:hypothetical protein